MIDFTRIINVFEFIEKTSDNYYMLGIPLEYVEDEKAIEEIESSLNDYEKREGFHTYPVKDKYGEYVCIDYPNKIVLCVIQALWG
jgi:hypothetical protein